MKLSIITINRNNADGLRRTVQSVLSQTCSEIEYIIVDGASTDASVAVIEELVGKQSVSHQNGITIKWHSEPDKGIYNAMNKGIRQATGEFIEILNSGDLLADNHVVERMLAQLAQRESSVDILYGNMIKQWPGGHTFRDDCGGPLTMLSFYFGTLNHDPAYIRRSLFDRYGYYDESLRIVSDWEWYLQVLCTGAPDKTGHIIPPIPSERLQYVNIDVTIFDMSGVSESNTQLWPVERRPVLERCMPPMMLADYDRFGEDMRMVQRLKRHHLHGVVRFAERVLFKLEKWGILPK